MAENYGLVSYVFGIMSIVFGFVSPLAGLLFGIIGMNLSGKQKSEMSTKGKKYSKIGIVISVIMLIITIVASIYLYYNPIAGI